MPGRHTLFPVQGAQGQPFNVIPMNLTPDQGSMGINSRRYYTIQRVNGNGKNGRNDGVIGGHRHTLEESDRVKKNSVQRALLKDKGKKKGTVRYDSTVINWCCWLLCDLFNAVGWRGFLASPRRSELRHSWHRLQLLLLQISSIHEDC